MSSGLGGDGVGGAQDDNQVAQRGAHGARMASTRRAMAARKVMLDELSIEPLVDVRQALVGILHPSRQVCQRRFAVAHLAGGIAAIQEVLAVPRDVAVQLSAAAGTNQRIGARTRLDAHGGLQVVAPPVHLGTRTMYRCSRHQGRTGRFLPYHRPPCDGRLHRVETYAQGSLWIALNSDPEPTTINHPQSGPSAS
jgi:hypothetical protein